LEKRETLSCSFCGKVAEGGEEAHRRPTVYICDRVHRSVQRHHREEIAGEEKREQKLRVPRPSRSRSNLDEYVVGRAGQKTSPSRSTTTTSASSRGWRWTTSSCRSRTSSCSDRPGRAKTLLAQPLAKILNVPFHHRRRHHPHRGGLRRRGRREIIVNLLPAADHDIGGRRGSSTSTRSTKIARKSEPSITRDVSGEECSRRCSRIIEGTVANVPPKAGASTRSRSSCRSTPPTSSSSRRRLLRPRVHHRAAVGGESLGWFRPEVRYGEERGRVVAWWSRTDLLKFGK